MIHDQVASFIPKHVGNCNPGSTYACFSMSNLELVFDLTLPFFTLSTLSMSCMSSTRSDSMKDGCQGCADGGQ